ncbi:MAG: hypothetical protein NZL96_01500 [Patescibacteria group bacterium]|nr:hypothetical protein [Patescibacteria group bacterium]
MIRLLISQQINVGGQRIQGPLQIPGVQPDRIRLADVINRILQFLIPLAGVILLFVLIWGGYDLLLSQGNPEKLKAARAKITSGLVGFFLLLLSYLLVRFISFIFGLQGGII